MNDALEGEPTPGPSTIPPESTSPASTSPTVSPTTSGECHAIGEWEDVLSMDEWCNENCPANCPSDMCACD